MKFYVEGFIREAGEIKVVNYFVSAIGRYMNSDELLDIGICEITENRGDIPGIIRSMIRIFSEDNELHMEKAELNLEDAIGLSEKEKTCLQRIIVMHNSSDRR